MSENKWSTTAQIIVDDSLGIKKGEKVLLVVGDGVENADEICDLYGAVKDELFERGLDPTIISYRATPGVEPPALIEEACCLADVIIFIYVRGMLHSGTYPRIQKNKKPSARILMLPNGNSCDYLNRMMPKTKEEFYEVADITGRVGGKFLGGPHKVRVTSRGGTDLSFTLGALGGWNHTGIGKEPGAFAMLPAGTLNLGVDPGSAQGVMVIDTFTAVNRDLLNGKIIFEIHDGYATSITGGEEADEFVAASEKYEGTSAEKFAVAEFGLGFSKIADYRVSLSEGEHVYAATHIGIGSNATFGGDIIIPDWHSDSLITDATVELDGEIIAKDGEYLV